MYVAVVVLFVFALTRSPEAFSGHHRVGSPWMVDEAYNVRDREWYKYDCREVRYLFECRNKNGGIYNGMSCFKPYDVNLRHYHLLDGWHKELKCKTSSPDDYAVLAANDNGDVVSVGRGVASKIIRCNNRGKWVASLGSSPQTEIEISDAFCFVIPSNDMNEGEQAAPSDGGFADEGQM